MHPEGLNFLAATAVAIYVAWQAQHLNVLYNEFLLLARTHNKGFGQ